MKIKYGELPPIDVCRKLVSVTFDSPKKNLEVYKFCKIIAGCLDYVQNEKVKLFQRLGKESNDHPGLYQIEKGTDEYEEFNREWDKILDLDVDSEIIPLPLSEEDFDEGRCLYSPNKSNWLSAYDIGIILKFCGE